MEVWIFECPIEDVLRVFSSEEKMWNAILAWFREEDEDWTLKAIKKRIENSPELFTINNCKIE